MQPGAAGRPIDQWGRCRQDDFGNLESKKGGANARQTEPLETVGRGWSRGEKREKKHTHSTHTRMKLDHSQHIKIIASGRSNRWDQVRTVSQLRYLL